MLSTDLRNWLWIVLLLTQVTACGWFSKDSDETKDWTASQFYSEAKAALDGGNYDQAIKYYEKLEARYPFGPYAKQAQLDVAYAYYKYEEPEAALAACDRFIKLNPRDPAVDYAYYLKGLVNFNRNTGFLDRFMPTDPSQRDPGSARDSFNDFAELVRRFPDSKYAADARQRMIFLRNTLAQYEVNVADYYVRRGAFVAAADRCNYTVENYPRTPAVKQALELMTIAYTQLGMTEMAADTQRVLALNLEKGTFGGSTEAEVDKTWGRRFWNFIEMDRN
jgi:outer membrane protein assembly factor BamD